VQGESIPAYEMKFVVPEAVARQLEAWADRHLQRDSFADLRHGGSYQTTTLYLDTPTHDVFHRSPGFRRRKFRVRRYGSEPTLYLERKARWGDRVKKRRSDNLERKARWGDRVKKRRSDIRLEEILRLSGPAGDESWSGHWFATRMMGRGLQPSCRVTYERTAFVSASPTGPLRLTFDRHVRGVLANGWDATPVDDGHAILPGEVICEFKFRETMPEMFKLAIAVSGLQPGSCSKYRRIMAANGLVEQPRSASA
jgi:hypothetical protein